MQVSAQLGFLDLPDVEKDCGELGTCLMEDTRISAVVFDPGVRYARLQLQHKVHSLACNRSYHNPGSRVYSGAIVAALHSYRGSASTDYTFNAGCP